MNELGINNLQKLTEEERRKKYSKQMSIISFLAMGAFMILLIIGFASENGRECGERQALEAAVCVDCASKNCMQCDENSAVCQKCEKGYVLSSDGRCVDCDDQEFIKCLECSLKDDGIQTECTQCALGHRLENGKCTLCDELFTCNTCTTEKCIECSEGFRLDGGLCHACSNTLHHCEGCTTEDSCEVCNENIAGLGSNGKCDRCQYGWTDAPKNQLTNCECSDFVNTFDNYKCQTCFELIPDCQICEQVDDPGDSFAVQIGYDSVLSPNTGQYLVCKEAVQGTNMIQNAEDGTFASCQDLFPGCKRCNEEGTFCEECEDRHMRTDSDSCMSCEYWSQEWSSHVCAACQYGFGCTQCENGYWLLGSGCWKAYW